MDKLSNVYSIAFYNLRKWLTNPRIYLIFFMIFLYLHSILSPIITFCFNSEYNISLYLFPFIMSDVRSVLLIMLGIVLLFCDAPFIDIDQPYIIMRSGRTVWVWGQIVYIGMASFIYFFIIILFSILILFPCLKFDPEWGKVIGTFAQTNVAPQHNIVIPFAFSIYNAYTPIGAMCVTFLNSSFISFALGLLMFVLNLNLSRFTGALGATLLVLWQVVVTNTWTGFTRFSPVSWVSLSRIDTTTSTLYPSLKYIYITITIMIILLSILCMRSMKKRDIDVLKSV